MIVLLVALLQAAAPKPTDSSTYVKGAEDARLPSLAFDGDGNAYVALVKSGNIQLAISTDGGKTFGSPVTVLNSGGKDARILNRGPRVSIDKNKRVWVSGPVSNAAMVNDLYFAVSSDRGKT